MHLHFLLSFVKLFGMLAQFTKFAQALARNLCIQGYTLDHFTKLECYVCLLINRLTITGECTFNFEIKIAWGEGEGVNLHI